MLLNHISNQLLLSYEGQFPRYTSYPTAPHFTTKIDGAVYSKWLNTLPEQDTLSLYIHVPFCRELCWYCGCHTKIAKQDAPIEAYVKILKQEIILVASLLSRKKLKVTHIHFGGGSPTILSPQSFLDVMKTIQRSFEITADAEIAIEVDPRTITEEKVNAYATAYVNRVSIGAQDFNPDVQQAIHRVQPFELVQSCINLFRQYGINNINIDLMYGLPKQTLESIQNNIEAIFLLNPNRISLFAYAHVHWMKKHMQLIKEEHLPSSINRLEMFQLATKNLVHGGYSPIGLDHFAKSTDPMALALHSRTLKRNFQGYSLDNASHLIGFGVSSISQLSHGYAQNSSNLSEYRHRILNHNLPIVRGIEISSEDQMRKKIIDDLMCYMYVDLNEQCKASGYPLDYFENEVRSLEALTQNGLITMSDNIIRIHPEARQISRMICSYFDQFFKASLQKHSSIL